MSAIRKLARWLYLLNLRIYTRHEARHWHSDFEVCDDVLCRITRPFDRFYLSHWLKYNRFMHGEAE